MNMAISCVSHPRGEAHIACSCGKKGWFTRSWRVRAPTAPRVCVGSSLVKKTSFFARRLKWGFSR